MRSFYIFYISLLLFVPNLGFSEPKKNSKIESSSKKEETAMPHESLKLKIAETLDNFHLAASKADGDRYFSFFAKNGIFIGTDASERWTVEQFKAYADPHFKKGKGWTYKARSRNIDLSANKDFAWFDEILDSESYGTSRGTGVLLLTHGKWLIAQYHLTFPIPNDLAGKFTTEIKSFENKK